MEIVFSRHAKRRLRLYSIDEEDVIAALNRKIIGMESTATRGALIDESFAGKYVFPLKIVFVVEESQIVVVSAYPLKRGMAK